MLERGLFSGENDAEPPVPVADGPELFAAQLDIDRLVPIYNPYNREAHKVLGRLARVAAHDVEITPVHTVAGGAYPNAERLYDNRHLLGSRSLAVLIGGDGTAHTVTNGFAIAGEYHPGINETKRLFELGGTAGDTAKALNSPRLLARPDTLVQAGWLVDVYPLEMTIDSDDETVPNTIHALSYMSLGNFTGLAAEYINSPEHRGRLLNRYRPTKRLAQGLTGLRALRDAQQVDITVNHEETRRTLDIHCLSGPIMATLKHRSKELTEPGFHIVENTEPRFGYLLGRALRLGAGKLIDKEVTPQENLRLTTHNAAILQADGETWRVPAGTTVAVKPGEPFQAITTRRELQATT